MNLLLEYGHPAARSYPISLVWEESELVVERLNGLEATRAILLQSAVSSVLSKEGAAGFKKAVALLTES